MFYDPDKFDAVITVLKFLTVFSSGMLAGQCLYVSRTHSPSLLEIKQVEHVLGSFRFYWTNGLRMYQSTLVGVVAGFAVFMLEVRDSVSWLYGTIGILSIFLYTKFYLCPRVINYLLDPDFSKKGDGYISENLVKFHHGHHPRTLLSVLSFIWLTYSLYRS